MMGSDYEKIRGYIFIEKSMRLKFFLCLLDAKIIEKETNGKKIVNL